MRRATDKIAQDIRLIDVFQDLWNAKIYMVFGLSILGILAIGFIALAKPHYRVSMMLSAANPMNGTEVSSMLANDNLFALRFLAQRVGVANSSDFVRFENIFSGPSVAGALLQDKKILDVLNSDQSSVFKFEQKEWNAERFSAYLKKRVSLQTVSGSSLRNMVYFHPDPLAGKYLLQQIHLLTDQLIRKTIRLEARARVKYLQKAIAETNHPEHRRALTTLLLEQERLLMLVSIDQPYAASVVEPPSASVKPAWPNTLLFLIGFGFIGAFVGFIAHSLRHGQRVLQYTAMQGRRLNQWYKPQAENANYGRRKDDVKAAE